MTTILASPARQPASALPAPPHRRATRAASVEQDVMDWLIDACADHLAAAPQPTKAALAAHLVAKAGYRIADGFDQRAHNMRVDLALGIAARLLHGDCAELHGLYAEAISQDPHRTESTRSAR
jgi:hypothetical protein